MSAGAAARRVGPGSLNGFRRAEHLHSAALKRGGHCTEVRRLKAFRQLAVALLGVEPAQLRVLNGDTDVVAHGRGTFGSRSLMAGGAALVRAADKIVARGKAIAAHLLEADEADISFADGRFTVAGTDRGLRIEEVARALGEDEKRSLASALHSALHKLRNPHFDNPQLQ